MIMQAPTAIRPEALIPTLPSVAPAMFEDPLDRDAADDAMVPTTRRGLIRVALIAAETAARLHREDRDVDPMAWMLAPRRVFGGRAAIDACLEREACVRALLLHGLGMDLDADPAELDDLASDDEGEEDGHVESPDGRGGRSGCDGEDGVFGMTAGPRLYTSTAAEQTEDGWVHVFHAAVASSREEARASLRRSRGHGLAACADTVEGFRPDLPLAQALVSSAVADMLEQVDRDPSSSLARGLDVSIEQRFSA